MIYGFAMLLVKTGLKVVVEAIKKIWDDIQESFRTIANTQRNVTLIFAKCAPATVYICKVKA